MPTHEKNLRELTIVDSPIPDKLKNYCEIHDIILPTVVVGDIITVKYGWYWAHPVQNDHRVLDVQYTEDPNDPTLPLMWCQIAYSYDGGETYHDDVYATWEVTPHGGFWATEDIS